MSYDKEKLHMFKRENTTKYTKKGEEIFGNAGETLHHVSPLSVPVAHKYLQNP